MRAGRVVAIVIGSILALVAAGMLVGAVAIGAATAFLRDDDGYFEVTLERATSDEAAIVSDDLTLGSDAGTPDWVFDLVDVDVRLTASGASSAELFVGIGPASDVAQYLAGVAHDVVVEVDGDRLVTRSREGVPTAAPPGEQTFWTVSAEGPGPQVLEWETEAGDWAAVLMNADGSSGIAADVEVGARSGMLVPIAFALVGLGLVLLLAGVVLIIFGAHGAGRPATVGTDAPAAVAAAGSVTPAPGPVREPVLLDGRLDPDLSNWQWLVKWFLAIPHLIVLVFLWIAFFVLTIVAGIAILFTARYPRSIFDFNVGVLRWTWRVVFYAFTGGLGTDRYPPFRLAGDPDDPARLEVAYPERLSRGLVLVKWWLLAIPHYLVLSVLLGTSTSWIEVDGGSTTVVRATSVGLLGILTLIAAIALLFRGRQIRSLFDLIVGFNRWVVRVTVYAALMTDRYPPFRLDQGGTDPGHEPEPGDGAGASLGTQPWGAPAPPRIG